MLRLDEVAKLLSCSLSNVHNLVKSGRLPALSTALAERATESPRKTWLRLSPMDG